MSRYLLPTILLLIPACRATGSQPTASRSQTDDVREVEAVLRRWYDASEKHDSAGWTDAMLPSFFIFEDTTVYDKATISREVVESFALGTDRATLSDFKTVVSGDVAWSSFRNDEVWTPNGGQPEAPRRFLESAVFRRVDGKWLLERYHATLINRSATP